MEGMLAEGIGRKTTRFQKTESSTGYDSDSCISPKKEHAVSEEDSSTGIASDVSDDESPVEKWKSQSKGANFLFLCIFLAFDKFSVARIPSQMTTTNSTFNHVLYT